MTPAGIKPRVIIDRLQTINELIAEINKLPLQDKEDFFSDSRNIWTAESCLRRSLEALFDMGRHILAKEYGRGVSEYKEIAEELEKNGFLTIEEKELMRRMAGYRNRLVHFYHEISQDELFEVCTNNLDDVIRLKEVIRSWCTQKITI